MLTVNMSRPGIATIDIVFPGTAPGSGGATGTGGTGTGGSSGTGGASMATPCTPQGDCTAVLKMDGASSIDPPIVRTGGDGVQGATSIDGVAGPACQVSETNQFHGLPFKERHWQLVGPGVTTGTNYKVTFHVTGVLECKTYQNLTNCPRAVNQGRAAIYDLWCPEGTDPPLTSASDHTNTVMLSVTPLASTTAPNIGPPKGPMPTAGNWWQLNECPQGANEGHTTWKVDYEKSITVPGGSWVNFVEFDTNCREMLNCGPSADSGAVCTEQFSILPPAGSVPAPPLTITQQPPAAGAGAFGQWVYFDVKSITPM